MALAEVDRLTEENKSLRTIAVVAMSALSADQLGRVRAELAQLDAGADADVPR